MTQPIPPSYPPMGNYGAANYGMPARPKALTVAAIMGIVFASLNLLCNGWGLIKNFGIAVWARDRQVELSRAFTVFNFADAAVFLLLAIVWMIVSIFLLKAALWAISAGRKLAIVHILLLVGYVVGSFALASDARKLYREQIDEQQRSQPASAQPMPAGMMDAMVNIATYGAPIIAALLGLVVPITMLIALSRPSVKSLEAASSNQFTGGYTPPM